MDCGKDSYTKAGAHSLRESIYKKRKKRLRIYQCADCFNWHLSSNVDGPWTPEINTLYREKERERRKRK